MLQIRFSSGDGQLLNIDNLKIASDMVRNTEK